LDVGGGLSSDDQLIFTVHRQKRLVRTQILTLRIFPTYRIVGKCVMSLSCVVDVPDNTINTNDVFYNENNQVIPVGERDRVGT
jgi:hypothetical protein